MTETTTDADPSDVSSAVAEIEDGEATEKSSEPSDEPPADGSTTDTDQRHWLTNDLLAGLYALSLVGMVGGHGLGWLNLQTVPEPLMWLYGGAVGSAMAWAFGREAVKAWRAEE